MHTDAERKYAAKLLASGAVSREVTFFTRLYTLMQRQIEGY